MKFSFIRKTSLQVQDIWKNGEFSNWLLSPLDPQSFQELVFKALKNRKRSGYVDRQQAGEIDWPKFIFLQTKATQTMMTTMNEVNNDKTKVLDELIFRSVSLVRFTAELDE